MPIDNNPGLAEQADVANVATTGGTLSIWNTDTLAKLETPSSPTCLSGMVISNNAALIGISGLSNVTNRSAGVSVSSHSTLASMAGLSGLTSVGGLVIYDNAALTSGDVTVDSSAAGCSSLADIVPVAPLVIPDGPATVSPP